MKNYFFQLKGNNSIPIWEAQLSVPEVESIQAQYHTLAGFAEVLLIADIDNASEIMTKANFSPETKNQFYKFLIKRDFERRYRDFVDANNNSKDYAETYRQISNFVFGRNKDSDIFKKLFYWIRIGDVEQIKQFLATNEHALNYIHQFNLDGDIAISYARKYIRAEIHQLFYQYELAILNKPVSGEDHLISLVKKIFFNLGYGKMTEALQLLESMKTNPHINLYKIALSNLLELQMLAAQMNQLEFLTAIKDILPTSRQAKLQEKTYFFGCNDLLKQFFSGATPLFTLGFYGRVNAFRDQVNKGLYSRKKPKLRSDIFVALAAGGHIELFKEILKSIEYQISIYWEIKRTEEIQNTQFYLHDSPEFLLVALGMGKLQFLKWFTKFAEDEKKLISPHYLKDGKGRNIIDVWALIAGNSGTLMVENTTPWQHMGCILTLKTVSLHTGMMDVVNAINYSWQQQIRDIEMVMKCEKFHDIFKNTLKIKLEQPFPIDFKTLICSDLFKTDLERVLSLVFYEAVSAIVEKFGSDLQQKLFKELIDASANYLHLFDFIHYKLAEKYAARPEAQALNLLWNTFISNDNNKNNHNIHRYFKEDVANKENISDNNNNNFKRKSDDQASAKVISVRGSFSPSPKKQKQPEQAASVLNDITNNYLSKSNQN